MKRIICLALCALLLLGAAFVAISAFPDPVSRGKQAVVGAVEGLGYDSNGRVYSAHNTNSYSTGTAFGISPVGGDAQYFVTNCHVVTAPDDSIGVVHIMVDGADIYKGSTMIPCEVLYTDADIDIAIIKAAYPVKGVSALPIRPVEAGLQGEHVYALGFPGVEDIVADENNYTMGDITVTDGIVSRLVTVDGVRAMSHTANINHGNSGGPLVDAYGQVVGINSFGYTDQENADKRNYAIYSDYIIDALNSLGIPYETGSASPYLNSVILAAAMAALAIAALILFIRMPAAQRKKAAATLRAVSGPLAGKTWQLYNTLKMGRGSGQDVALPNATKGVSREHCVLQRQDGGLVLTDLQSTCGTFLNGERLAANQPTPVAPGAIIWLGSDAVKFQLEYNQG